LSDKIWIEKFNLWKKLTKKDCTAATGPGGMYCMWVGRNCCYNACPRRSHEEIFVRADPVLEQEMEQLRSELNVKNEEIIILTEKLKIIPEEEKIENVEI